MDFVNLVGIPNPISRVGFGCCPLGEHGWGNTDHEELIRTVGSALDLGVTFFDTADVYGLGASEENLAEGLGGRRDEAVIGTKCGVRRKSGTTYYDSSPAWIREALEGSLSRLKTDYVDLFQLHYWDGETPLEFVAEAMEKMVEEGKILRWGVTNLNEIENYSLLFKEVSAFTFSFQYSLLDRDYEQSIREVLKRWSGSLFMAWGSLSQGLLTGKYGDHVEFGPEDRRARSEYRNFHGERFEKCKEVVARVMEMARAGGRSPIHFALRWILEGFDQSIVLVGVKSQKQLETNAEACGWKLSHSEAGELRELATKLGE